MINYDLLNDKAKQTFLYIQLLSGFLFCPRTALSFAVVIGNFGCFRFNH
jgi:hypothetical protein